MKKITMIIAAMAIVFGGLISFTSPAFAQPQYDLLTPTQLGIEYGAATGLGTTDVRQTVAQIIRVAMGLLGIVAVVIILIGGFKWMTAGGNEEQVGDAKKWIFSGVIGLAIILSAYALASFIINQLVTATTQTGPGY